MWGAAYDPVMNETNGVNAQLPRMARSWWLGCQAWAVALGGFVVVLLGAMVTHLKSTPVMGLTLGVPVAAVVALSVQEFLAARRHTTRLSRMHLFGVAIGLLVWLLYPTAPGDLSFNPSPEALCRYAQRPGSPECLAHAGAARLHAHVAWFATGALILLLAPLARRSRSAAWGTAAVGFAGAAFALHFLEVFVHPYG